MALTWRGKQVTEKLRKACNKGLLQTASDCVGTSKRLVHVKHTILQGSLQIDPKGVHRPNSFKMWIEWGSFNVVYAAAIEFGVQPRDIYPKNKKALYWPELGHPILGVHHNQVRAFPYLRPSADQNYPKLPGYIRMFFEGKI